MKIEAIRQPSGRGERLTLAFEDGKTMKVRPSVVADLGLYAGLDLTEDAIARLCEVAGQANAKARAVRIVSAGTVSQAELRRRLALKGESREHAEEAVQWLSELNLLDDAKAANQLAQSAARKGYGAARIKQIFYEKGIPKELWDDVLTDLPEPDDAIDRFVQSKLRGTAPDERELKRVIDALRRRGHRWADIQKALRRYTDALDDTMEDFDT